MPPPGPERPEERRIGRPRRIGWAVAVAVVVVVAGLSGAYFAGLGPFHRSPSAPHGAITFRQAESAGNSAADGYDGGGWDLISAASANVHQPEYVPLTALALALPR